VEREDGVRRVARIDGPMLDIVIASGQVVTPPGAGAWEIGIEGERIAAVGLPGFVSGHQGLGTAVRAVSGGMRGAEFR